MQGIKQAFPHYGNMKFYDFRIDLHPKPHENAICHPCREERHHEAGDCQAQPRS